VKLDKIMYSKVIVAPRFSIKILLYAFHFVNQFPQVHLKLIIALWGMKYYYIYCVHEGTKYRKVKFLDHDHLTRIKLRESVFNY
jgi:hypothetical protein